MPERNQIYTDGACSGNPGPGGWAWITTTGYFASGFAEQTTNQLWKSQPPWRQLKITPDLLKF